MRGCDIAVASLEPRGHYVAVYSGWYHVLNNAFTADECAHIIALCGAMPRSTGARWDGSGYSVNPNVRDVQTSYVARNAENAWVYARMDDIFYRFAQHWDLDVCQTAEDLKYLVYEAGNHFSQWHTDVGGSYAGLRRISMSVELSASSDYEGGDLQIFPRKHGHIAGAVRAAGTAVVFPSHWYHRVTPVIRGTRVALVNWISGCLSPTRNPSSP